MNITWRGWTGMAASLLCMAAVVTAGKLPDGKGKAPGFDPEQLPGTWEYLSGVKNGEMVRKEELEDESLIIDGQTFTLEGSEKFIMKYRLETNRHPVRVRFEVLESPHGPGAITSGIVEVSEEELRVCYAQPGGEIPKDFESPPGSNQHLFSLTRAGK